MKKLSHLELLNKLKDEKSSYTAFLIGGGPSLLKICPDYTALNGKDVLVTNNAYKIFPNSKLCFFADKAWYTWHKEKMHQMYTNPFITSATNHLFEWDKTPITAFWKGPMRGLSEKDDTLNGNNAGHALINLAVNIGYKKIVLIGFDMDGASKQSHWHNEHQRKTIPGSYNESMIPNMKSIIPFQEKLGFKIYNLNRKSKLDCFEFADLKDFIDNDKNL